jgi:hypothetical protein
MGLLHFHCQFFRLLESGNKHYFVTTLALRPPVFDSSTVIVYLIVFCNRTSSGIPCELDCSKATSWYYFAVSLAPRIHLDRHGGRGGIIGQPTQKPPKLSPIVLKLEGIKSFSLQNFRLEKKSGSSEVVKNNPTQRKLYSRCETPF